MNFFAVNIDLITGWFPTTVIIVAIASVVLSVGWHDGAWKWELPIGIPVSFVLTVLTALAIHIFNLVPDEFPQTFYLWAWLVWYSIVIIILGWTRAHWLLRIFSVIALVFCVLAAFTVVNQQFDYYPTLQRLLGKNAANFTDLPALKAIRTETRETGKLPDHGETIAVTIPGTVSKFHTGQAYVYLPPSWFASPEPQLPVIELIAGIPGQPSDWTRAGYADTTSTAFAEQHHGKSPILVIPDNNGNAQDTECSNSSLGNAETYLVKDVPAFMQANFNAAVGKHSLAVAGLSDGGTCASMLALRNPQVFQTFGDYSGYASPTYLNDNAQQTDHHPLRRIAGQLRSPQSGRPAHQQEVPGAGRVVHRRAERSAAAGRHAAIGPAGQTSRDAGVRDPARPGNTRSPSGPRPSRTRCRGCPGGSV